MLVVNTMMAERFSKSQNILWVHALEPGMGIEPMCSESLVLFVLVFDIFLIS